MSTRPGKVAGYLLAANIAALAWACSGQAPADDELDSWREQARINEAVRDWLNCEECIDGELERLQEFGDRARPAVEAALEASRTAMEKSRYAPDDPFQLHWVQAREEQRFRRLVESNPSLGERMSAESYARREIQAMLNRYSDRSKTALDALERSEHGKPCPKDERPFNPKD